MEHSPKIYVITKWLTYALDLCHLLRFIMSPWTDGPLRHSNCSSSYSAPFGSSKQLREISTFKLLKAVWVTSKEGTNGYGVISPFPLLATRGNKRLWCNLTGASRTLWAFLGNWVTELVSGGERKIYKAGRPCPDLYNGPGFLPQIQQPFIYRRTEGN